MSPVNPFLQNNPQNTDTEPIIQIYLDEDLFQKMKEVKFSTQVFPNKKTLIEKKIIDYSGLYSAIKQGTKHKGAYYMELNDWVNGKRPELHESSQIRNRTVYAYLYSPMDRKLEYLCYAPNVPQMAEDLELSVSNIRTLCNGTRSIPLKNHIFSFHMFNPEEIQEKIDHLTLYYIWKNEMKFDMFLKIEKYLIEKYSTDFPSIINSIINKESIKL